jgi:hypothetical protein
LPPAAVTPTVLVRPPPVLERAAPEPLVVDEVPLLLGTDPVPVLTTAPIPWVDPV